MPFICLFFKVHQPYRLKSYQAKEVDVHHFYWDEQADQFAINKVADESYLPANEIISKLIEETGGRFRVSFSISGTTIELLQKYRPDVIESFKNLFSTGCAELLGETFYHSLSSLHSTREFERQVKKHAELVEEVFGVTVNLFRNTELIHNNSISSIVSGLGFKGVLCEGVERILRGRTTNQVYQSPVNGQKLLLRNARLSDDIAFRFDDQNWSEHPLTAEKFAEWLHQHPPGTEVINLFLDYETFGLHKKKDAGIFDFLKALPEAVLRSSAFAFKTGSQVLSESTPDEMYNVEQTISWADRPEASCVWSENMMQHNMLKKIYSLEKMISSNGCRDYKDEWGRLQQADHFYYMHAVEESKYPNPFDTAEDAFRNYNNIVADFEIRLIRKNLAQVRKSAIRRPVLMNLF